MSFKGALQGCSAATQSSISTINDSDFKKASREELFLSEKRLLTNLTIENIFGQMRCCTTPPALQVLGLYPFIILVPLQGQLTELYFMGTGEMLSSSNHDSLRIRSWLRAVGHFAFTGDVEARCQWPQEGQDHRVPARFLFVTHQNF